MFAQDARGDQNANEVRWVGAGLPAVSVAGLPASLNSYGLFNWGGLSLLAL